MVTYLCIIYYTNLTWYIIYSSINSIYYLSCYCINIHYFKQDYFQWCLLIPVIELSILKGRQYCPVGWGWWNLITLAKNATHFCLSNIVRLWLAMPGYKWTERGMCATCSFHLHEVLVQSPTVSTFLACKPGQMHRLLQLLHTPRVVWT